jgi:hypothetical protein
MHVYNINKCVCVYTYTDTYMHTCIHIHAHEHSRRDRFKDDAVRNVELAAYKYTYMHTCIHTYIHTHEHPRRDRFKDDAVRNVELAAYLTHCKMQPLHLLIALRSAMSRFEYIHNKIVLCVCVCVCVCEWVYPAKCSPCIFLSPWDQPWACSNVYSSICVVRVYGSVCTYIIRTCVCVCVCAFVWCTQSISSLRSPSSRFGVHQWLCMYLELC